MLTRLRKKTSGENITFFGHFFAVFTGIFLVMTIIIIQVMQFGIYSSVDNSLKTAKGNIEDYVTMNMSHGVILPDGSEEESGFPFKVKTNGEMAANTDTILYDKKHRVLNSINAFSSLYRIRPQLSEIGEIVQQKTKNVYGQTETYRTITVKVKSRFYPKVKFATIVVNTTQLEQANKRYVSIIITVMIVFWFISVFASFYLAKWSRKPILENYERQKSFVENASHELRTPLAVLQNRLESLFRKPEATIFDSSESIASSLEEVRNMRLLTTNLLNLARRDDGIEPELADIQPIFFEEIFRNFQMIAEENGKALHIKNKVNRSIKTDKTLLKQLMTILFDNAVKYTDNNGEIWIDLKTTDRNLFFSVSDNGPGIADEDKKKIFDRFYRVDKARTRQKGGLGLGLSLAKQITDSLKGSILIKDRKPQGTIFEVRITLNK
ncbi:sensor histidine kinase [Streptococcus macacae]|uniref:histidine kinase n=1 Tax=Streptococcus macacae NCTC 11558 TaxID=764298 RepID=G5JVD3_9STRE|nr:HAMP domain-containing sensor histidine kinase [Streptococcus macacae]EHJ52080.1 ATPase/histidine kinase/DNA gyrase B/HSP90 domain protein [Streptococcus macacae NCTC 11558]SUN78529.1 histidine kinase sensor CiaH [Streptococcus macacae NCTC 11558]